VLQHVILPSDDGASCDRVQIIPSNFIATGGGVSAHVIADQPNAAMSADPMNRTRQRGTFRLSRLGRALSTYVRRMSARRVTTVGAPRAAAYASEGAEDPPLGGTLQLRPTAR